MREQLQNAGRQVQEGAQQVGERVRENYDYAREEAARRYRHAEGMMARNPTQSVMIAFGAGFGLGLVLTTLLSRPEETWADRHIPDRYRDRLRKTPDALHDLAESIRHMPDAISSRVSSYMGRS
jgi:ElaB/YqjD/DUF883 family membrane-anchored ribosome-binding protein